MRIAYASPLPPSPSGIADYSAELLPHLAEHLEVELLVEDGARPKPALAARFPVHRLESLGRLLAERRFDLVVYQLGNDAGCHAGIYRALLEHPGVVVLHEYMLHHLVRGLTLARGDAAGYVDAMRYCYGRSGEASARRLLATGVPLDTWSYPLFERAVDASLGILVHSEHARQRVLASRPAARVGRVALPFDPASATVASTAGKAGARAALGIPADAFVVATFGFVTPTKRLEVCLRAFHRLRRERPDALFYVVGEASPFYDVGGVLGREPADGVVLTGRVGLDDFQRSMAAADLALSLRHPTGGETSASVVRLLGLGVPTIVSRAGSFAELPDDACAKVDLDETEEELLAVYVRRLAADPELRRRMGENARRYVAEHHTLGGTARGYADFLRGVVESGARPFRAAPPLVPYPSDDVLADVLLEVTAAMGDLGVAGDDEELLCAVTATVVDLDLDLPNPRLPLSRGEA